MSSQKKELLMAEIMLIGDKLLTAIVDNRGQAIDRYFLPIGDISIVRCI